MAAEEEQVLATERLRLVSFSRANTAHYQDLLDLYSSPFVTAATVDRGLRSKSDVDEYLANLEPQQHWSSGQTRIPTHSVFLIYLKTEDSSGCEQARSIGAVTLSQRGSLPPDVGFNILESYTGRGIAGEAALAALQFWRIERGMRGVWAGTPTKNVRSRRVCEKIGMIEAARFRFVFTDGRKDDCMAFATLNERNLVASLDGASIYQTTGLYKAE